MGVSGPNDWITRLVLPPFVGSAVVVICSLCLMGTIANKHLPKEQRFYYPLSLKKLKALPEEYKRLFPDGLLYKVLSVSVICVAVFAGLVLSIEIWTLFIRK